MGQREPPKRNFIPPFLRDTVRKKKSGILYNERKGDPGTRGISLRTFMGKEALIEVIRRVLKTDLSLTFLMKLEREELEKILVCIRERLELEKAGRGTNR